MTKKDYVRIAAALAKGKPTHDADMPQRMFNALSMQWCSDLGVIADALAADNPRFDRARFYAACGMEG